MGFTVDMHYCGGKMKSYSLFGDAKSCYAKGDMVCYADDKDDSHEHQQCSLKRKKCCENRKLVMQPVENLNNPVFSSSPHGDHELNVVTYAIGLSLDELFFDKTLIDREYRPPLLLRSTPAFLQSFLI